MGGGRLLGGEPPGRVALRSDHQDHPGSRPREQDRRAGKPRQAKFAAPGSLLAWDSRRTTEVGPVQRATKVEPERRVAESGNFSRTRGNFRRAAESTKRYTLCTIRTPRNRLRYQAVSAKPSIRRAIRPQNVCKLAHLDHRPLVGKSMLGANFSPGASVGGTCPLVKLGSPPHAAGILTHDCADTGTAIHRLSSRASTRDKERLVPQPGGHR